MNFKELRDEVFARADWDPAATTTAVTRVKSFINRAYQQLALEAPFLFFEQQIKFATQPDAEPYDENDTISLVQTDATTGTNKNPWVFRTARAAGAPNATIWADGRAWDGRMIDIIEADGTVHKNRIRSVWRQTDGATTYFFVSVFYPWQWWNYGVGPFTWRVYCEYYYLPDDVIELRSARIVGSDHQRPLTVIGQREAEEIGIVDHQFSSGGTGPPNHMYRRGHFQLQGPNTAPILKLGNLEFAEQKWKGPEPYGEFEYCVTYTWGKRDTEDVTPGIAYWNTDGAAYIEDDGTGQSRVNYGNNRVHEPLFESAPSPAASITVEAPTSDGASAKAVLIALPNIEYMQGFGLQGLTGLPQTAFRRISAYHSGWHVRIYRKRKSFDLTRYTLLGAAGGVVGQHAESLKNMDVHDEFFLLAEVHIESLNDSVFIDDGTILPDYHRRLRDTHGYQAIRLHPAPDARYEIECRVIRRPQKLASDSDVPLVHAEASELLINRALAILYEHMNEPERRRSALVMYNDHLQTLRKRYGDLRPQNQPVYRRPARMGRRRSVVPQWWKPTS